jgi:hypothetical protein
VAGAPPRLVHAVLVVLASAALALWAGDEALRGVNPFGRFLGVAVLAWLAFAPVRRGCCQTDPPESIRVLARQPQARAPTDSPQGETSTLGSDAVTDVLHAAV